MPYLAKDDSNALIVFVGK